MLIANAKINLSIPNGIRVVINKVQNKKTETSFNFVFLL